MRHTEAARLFSDCEAARPGTFLTLALCLLPFAFFLSAEQPQAPPVFRAGIDIVQVDVSALDRDRRPVRGLTVKDFTVLEDGRPQAIVAFSSVDVPEPVAPPAAWMYETTPDVQTNRLEERRLFVLLLDDAMLPFDQAMVNAAKAVARGVVDRLGPADLAAVVFTRDNRHAQEFTSDRARLLKAVDALTGGFALSPPPPSATDGASRLTPPDPDTYYQLSSVSTLNRVTEQLIAVPERRKAVVYVTIGVPFDPEMLGPGANLNAQGVQSQLLQMLQGTFRQARRANVNVYTVDPSGLGVLESYIQQQHLRNRASAEAAMTIARRQANLHLDFMETVAENTAGRATVNSNDFASAIEQMFRENGSYYLLGYRPSSRPDGRFRRLEVRVSRPGVTVRARNGYYADPPGNPPRAAPVVSPLTKALAGLLPNPEMAMRVSVAPFGAQGTEDGTVAIMLGLRQPAPPAAPGAARVVENVDLEVSAFTPSGERRATMRQTARLTLRANVAGDALYEVLARLRLKPGRYQLRLAAHNRTRDTTGSVYADVDVPEFASEVLSLSGVVLGVTPALASAPKDALAALLPFAPTSQREFVASHQVRSFLRIYQGGRRPLAPVTMAVRIVDGLDGAVLGAVDTIGPDRFSPARAADYHFELPIARLAPGPYLLTFEATLPAGHLARRDVQFVVK
jgi:VWFA-related protein